MTDATPKAIVDGTGLVLNVVAGSDVTLPPGCTLVDIGPGAEPGGTYAKGVFTPSPAVPRTATAKQVRYALNDLGVRSAWNAAVAASSQGAQDYWTSADPMVEDNGKIAKWCAAVSITPRALFDHAVTE